MLTLLGIRSLQGSHAPPVIRQDWGSFKRTSESSLASLPTVSASLGSSVGTASVDTKIESGLSVALKSASKSVATEDADTSVPPLEPGIYITIIITR
jgi:hypothetical protein